MNYCTDVPFQDDLGDLFTMEELDKMKTDEVKLKFISERYYGPTLYTHTLTHTHTHTHTIWHGYMCLIKTSL